MGQAKQDNNTEGTECSPGNHMTRGPGGSALAPDRVYVWQRAKNEHQQRHEIANGLWRGARWIGPIRVCQVRRARALPLISLIGARRGPPWAPRCCPLFTHKMRNLRFDFRSGSHRPWVSLAFRSSEGRSSIRINSFLIGFWIFDWSLEASTQL